MPPIATLNTDQSLGPKPRLRETNTGWAGVRSYLVDTYDEMEAINAQGVPAIGESWSLQATNLAVVDRACEYFGGANESGLDTGGYCVVTVTYQTAGMHGSIPPPVKGEKYTMLQPSAAGVTRYFAVGAAAGAPPLAGGDGVSIEAPTDEAVVVSYPEDGIFNPALHMDKRQKVNNAVLMLPNVAGLGMNWTMAAGQVRYKYTEVGRNGELLELKHHLAIAPDFLYRESILDSDGNFDSIGDAVQVYEEADLSGLW